MNFEKEVNKIQSLFTSNHAHIIYGLIRWIKPGVCLEIGSFSGYISAWIAKALQDNDQDGVLLAVDNWSLGTTSDQLHNNLNALGVGEIVYIYSPETIVNVTTGIDFAFIDGDHSFDGVRKDFHFAASRGAQCIVVHDTCSWWGPRQLIDKYDNKHTAYNMIDVGFDEGLAIFMKKVNYPPLTYTQEEYPKGNIKDRVAIIRNNLVQP